MLVLNMIGVEIWFAMGRKWNGMVFVIVQSFIGLRMKRIDCITHTYHLRGFISPNELRSATSQGSKEEDSLGWEWANISD